MYYTINLTIILFFRYACHGFIGTIEKLVGVPVGKK